MLPAPLPKKPKHEVEVSEAYAKIEKKKKVNRLWKRAAYATRASARFKLAVARAANSHTGLSLAFDDMDMSTTPVSLPRVKHVSTTNGGGKKVRLNSHSKAATTKDIAGSSHTKAKYLPPSSNKTALRFLPKKVERSLKAVKEESEDSD